MFQSVEEAYEAGQQYGQKMYKDCCEEGDFDPSDDDPEDFAVAVLDDMEENKEKPYTEEGDKFIKDYEDGFIDKFEELTEKDCDNDEDENEE